MSLLANDTNLINKINQKESPFANTFITITFPLYHNITTNNNNYDTSNLIYTIYLYTYIYLFISFTHLFQSNLSFHFHIFELTSLFQKRIKQFIFISSAQIHNVTQPLRTSKVPNPNSRLVLHSKYTQFGVSQQKCITQIRSMLRKHKSVETMTRLSEDGTATYRRNESRLSEWKWRAYVCVYVHIYIYIRVYRGCSIFSCSSSC